MTTTGITVSGSGTAAGIPDRAVLRLASEAAEVNVAEAVSSASESLAAMRAALLGQNVREADLQTSDVSVHQDHGRSRPRGYIARFGLVAVLQDADAAGPCAQAAVDAGGDAARLDGLSYQHSNPAELRSAAREGAFADARAKAEQLAGLAGQQLGAIDEISEHDGGSPRPVSFRAMAAADQEMAFSPGEQEMRVTLTIRWAWA